MQELCPDLSSWSPTCAETCRGRNGRLDAPSNDPYPTMLDRRGGAADFQAFYGQHRERTTALRANR
jgi:hypothetical protein